MYDPDQEKSLVLAAQAGNQDKFGKLYDALLPGLYGYVRARMFSDAEAEDVVSEVILTVVKKLRDFRWRHPGSFRAWVFQIARRELVDFYRQNSHTSETLDEHDSLPDLLAQPETLFSARETRTNLLSQIGQLSPRKQEVITLRYFGGLHNQEIAAVLDIDERTVSSYLSRALDELQTVIREP